MRSWRRATAHELVGSTSEVVVDRLNWAGLGVVAEAQPATEQKRGGDRCVPLSRVGERLEVLWREDGRGRLVGERLSPPLGGWEATGCEQALRCPGCTLRHLTQVERAQAQVESHLAAIERLCPGATSGAALGEVLSVARDGYRARLFARLFRDERGELSEAGMWARWGPQVDLRRCPVQTEGSRRLLEELFTQARRLQWPQELEAMTVQAMGREPEGFVILHARHPAPEALASSLRLDELPSALVGRCAVYLSSLHPSAPRRSEPTLVHLCGPRELKWSCGEGLRWSLSLPAWLPQSPSSVSALRRAAWRALDCPPQAQVFELGCGSGLLSLWLLTRGVSVRGADLDARAVEAAMSAYLQLKARDLSDLMSVPMSAAPSALPRLDWGDFSAASQDGRRALAQVARAGWRVDRLLVHAMRSPLSGLLPLAAHLGIPRVCYIAPSAPSLARDLAEEPRYQLQALQWLDQTPGSAQLLTIATLTLKAP